MLQAAVTGQGFCKQAVRSVDWAKEIVAKTRMPKEMSAPWTEPRQPPLGRTRKILPTNQAFLRPDKVRVVC